MSLLNQNKGKGKKGKKDKSQAQGNSKFIIKPSAAKAQGGGAQKPHKAGGSRGS
jgi:hypothetical protein